MTKPSWLPEALRYTDFNGDWERFLAAVYQIFERDFKKARPLYKGRTVIHDTKIEDGKEVGFWHVVQKTDVALGERIPDLRRCERIPWPRPMIEHSMDTAISVWKNERKKQNRKNQTRVLIWLEDLDYLVVLAERAKEIVLVTAYCTDIKSQKEKLKKERDNYYKMQKPPRRTT